MQARAVTFIFLTMLMAIAAGAFIAPSHKEVALMQMRDANFEEAFKLYNGLHDQGDNSIGIVAPLVDLYIHYGDTNKAVRLLEHFVSKHKRAIDVRKKLANLYKSSQRLYDYCRIMEELQVLAPSVDNLRKLADMYDFLGLYPQEQHALERLIDSKGYSPREDDYVKLAILDRTSNQKSQAVDVIVSGLEARKYHVNVDTVHLAAQLLLDEKQSARALSIVNDYITGGGSENDAITLSSLFQVYGKLDDAYKILAPYLADVDKSLDLERQLVGVWLAQKKDDQVFDLLSRQFTQNILPPALSSTFTDLAIKRKDYELVNRVIKAIDLESISEDALLRYADFSFTNKYPSIAKSMQANLGPEFLKQTPLLGTVLEVAATGSQKAVDTLLRMPEGYIVLPEEKLTVAEIFIQYGYKDRAVALFENIPIISVFEILDPIQVASLYLDSNQSLKGEQKLKVALVSSSNPAVDLTLFYLNIGMGRTEAVRQWLNKHESEDGSWLPDAYSLAARYHRNDLAVEFAKRMYDANQTTENLLQLTDALTANQNYAEAFQYLRKSATKGGSMRKALLEVMEAWLGQVATYGLGAENPDKFESKIVSALNDLKLSSEEKRNFVYLLQNAKLYTLAEGYFVDLANGQPFGSHDVEELLGFWNDNFSPAAINWILNRARDAAPPEKAKWLTYLNDAHQEDQVIAVLENEQDLSQQLTYVYIDALVNKHDKERLRPVLKKAVSDETDPKQLAHLADIAEGENMLDIAERAWASIYDDDPNNNEAAKKLGLAAFDKREYTKALPLLKQYLKANGDDYQASYAYAEIIKKAGNKDKAATYYQQALDQVESVQDQTTSTSLDKARLLHLNHRTNESIQMLRQMLAQEPDNKNVRAELAEILIETKRLKEASAILDQQ